ncbi:type I restriction enzyme S subunit [Pedobacter sp. CAN_A7]|uniref:restriction endonuclease subunit S n=1 Tax=Pedobacter sp. CAN_A7 TaxID=2787722 RepID=UPI0018CB05A8
MKYTKLLLGDLALQIKTGKTPPTNEDVFFQGGTINWYAPGDFKGNKYLPESSKKISDFAVSEGKAVMFEKGTVLITCIGSDLGKPGMLKDSSSSNQQITGVVVDESIISSEFFFYWVLRNKALLSHYSNYAVIPILNNSVLRKIPVYFPQHLSIQSKIVSQLDVLQSLIEKRKRSIQLYEKLIESTFLQMFGPQKVREEKWSTVSFKDIILKSQYGISDGLDSTSVGTPILRMNNITNTGDFDLSNLKYKDLPDAKFRNYKLNKRDLLFNRTNSRELVGKNAVWDNDIDCCFAGYLVRFIINEEFANPYFVSGYLNSSFGKRLLFNYAKSSGNLTNFSPPLLEKQAIFLPPIEEQKKYEHIIVSLKKKRELNKKSLKSLIDLFNAILQETFKGEEIISEGDIFEDLLKEFNVTDFLGNKSRLENLVSLINDKKIKDIATYDIAKELIFILLDEPSSGLKQQYNNRKNKMELIIINEIN